MAIGAGRQVFHFSVIAWQAILQKQNDDMARTGMVAKVTHRPHANTGDVIVQTRCSSPMPSTTELERQ